MSISRLCRSQFLFSLVIQEGLGSWLKRLWSYLDHKFTIGNFSISATTMAIGIAILLGSFIVSRTLRSFLQGRFEGRKRIDASLLYTLLRLLHYFVVGIGVLLAFRTAFNADLTTLAVVFTALSVGIGFGLQYIAGDIASGFILLFERPVRVGDFITVSGPDNKLTEGRVHSINLRTTIVVNNDHVTVIVPNSKLVNQALINWTYLERRSRIPIPINVVPGSDVDLVTATLVRAAEGVKFLLEEPKSSVQFLGFADGALSFRLLVWTDRPRRYPQIKSDINYRIEKLFREAKIKMPVPPTEYKVSLIPVADNAEQPSVQDPK